MVRAGNDTELADRGVDSVAHPDPLGFERPMIEAQESNLRYTGRTRRWA